MGSNPAAPTIGTMLSGTLVFLRHPYQCDDHVRSFQCLPAFPSPPSIRRFWLLVHDVFEE